MRKWGSNIATVTGSINKLRDGEETINAENTVNDTSGAIVAKNEACAAPVIMMPMMMLQTKIQILSMLC